MLNPVQVASSPHLSEQSSSEEDGVVSLARSSAHVHFPFFSSLESLYDIT